MTLKFCQSKNKPSPSHVSVLLASSVDEILTVPMFETAGPTPASFPMKAQSVISTSPDTIIAPLDRLVERKKIRTFGMNAYTHT